VIERSARIRHRFIELTEEHGFNLVMVYFSIDNEVETYELAKELLRMGKTVCAPVTDKRKRRLLTYTVDKVPDHLVEGSYGIPEPSRDEGRPVEPEMIDAVVVPGVAFDVRGYRIGYGAGYYDRFLPSCSRAIFIGLAFEIQVVDRIPNDEWDMPLHMVITEERIIEARSKGVRS
jgi:5-formyltetrahydrofolate cyclo-ligase